MKRLFACVCLALAACAPPASAPASAPARPSRIVSLDYCADQFVLKLADRNQIAAVSPDAGKDFSYMRAAAQGVPQARPNAEDVLAARPDLVVRAYGGGPNVEALLGRAGVPVAQLGFAEDLDGVRSNIRAMAAAVGHPARGEALIAEMDARLAGGEANRSRVSALYMTAGGATAGEGTLMHALMQAAGLDNLVRTPGWGPIPLEQLAYERPDVVVAAFFASRDASTDSWSSARHPIARRQLQDRPVAALEGAWTACGGWFLVEAVEAMRAARVLAQQ